MRMHKQERTQKAKRIDKDGRYDEEEAHVDDRARERFKRKPYEVDDVAGYMAKKYDIKKEVDL